jgi:poly(3-hydroxybutyrate) depolymerase
VNGQTREYLLELPDGYDGTTRVPVVFAFHGTTATAESFLGQYYGGARNGAAGRVLLVGPQGLVRDGQTGWISFGGSGSGSGIEQVDIDFFDALVALLNAEYCVDPGRFFSIGHSAGGFISNQLGCERGTVLRGVGPFAGGGPMQGSWAGVECTSKVAAFIGHNPYEGDPELCAQMDGGECPWVVEWESTGWQTTLFWTEQNECDDPGEMPTTHFDGNGETGDPLPCRDYSGCDPSYPVRLCLYDHTNQWDGPHAMPSQWGARAAIDFFLALP